MALFTKLIYVSEDTWLCIIHPARVGEDRIMALVCILSSLTMVGIYIIFLMNFSQLDNICMVTMEHCVGLARILI